MRVEDCTDAASKHVVCHESHELGCTSEKGFEIQLLTWHVDLCDAHLSGLPQRYSIAGARIRSEMLTTVLTDA